MRAMRLLTYMTPGFPASLFEAIGRILDVNVEYETEASGPLPGQDPFADDDGTELGWVCSTSFVDMAATGDAPSIQLVGIAWVPDDPDVDGRPVYFGDIVTRPNSGITSFEDLGGKRVGCNDPVSLSGHYALNFELDRRDLDDGYLEKVFTGGHQASLTAVASGDLDAAIVDSVVRTTRTRIDPSVAELKVVERLGPWPTQPLVARISFDAHEVANVRQRLLAAAEDPVLGAELRAAGLSHLVEVGPDHYGPVRDAMSRLANSSA